MYFQYLGKQFLSVSSQTFNKKCFLLAAGTSAHITHPWGKLIIFNFNSEEGALKVSNSKVSVAFLCARFNRFVYQDFLKVSLCLCLDNKVFSVSLSKVSSLFLCLWVSTYAKVSSVSLPTESLKFLVLLCLSQSFFCFFKKGYIQVSFCSCLAARFSFFSPKNGVPTGPVVMCFYAVIGRHEETFSSPQSCWKYVNLLKMYAQNC